MSYKTPILSLIFFFIVWRGNVTRKSNSSFNWKQQIKSKFLKSKKKHGLMGINRIRKVVLTWMYLYFLVRITFILKSLEDALVFEIKILNHNFESIPEVFEPKTFNKLLLNLSNYYFSKTRTQSYSGWVLTFLITLIKKMIMIINDK